MAYGGYIYILGMESGHWDNFNVSTYYTPPKPRKPWQITPWYEKCEYSEDTYTRKIIRFVINLPFSLIIPILQYILYILLLLAFLSNILLKFIKRKH